MKHGCSEGTSTKWRRDGKTSRVFRGGRNKTSVRQECGVEGDLNQVAVRRRKNQGFQSSKTHGVGETTERTCLLKGLRVFVRHLVRLGETSSVFTALPSYDAQLLGRLQSGRTTMICLLVECAAWNAQYSHHGLHHDAGIGVESR